MPEFVLLMTGKAKAQYDGLAGDPAKNQIFKTVRKTLALLHPGLNTHEWESEKGPYGGKLWEAYAQNRTPGTYRVFFGYGPDRGEITVTSIEPHP